MLAANLKILQAALGLRTPIHGGGNVDKAHAVVFNSAIHGGGACGSALSVGCYGAFK